MVIYVNSVSDECLSRLQFQYDEVALMMAIAEARGRQSFIEKRNPDIVKSLLEIAKVESVESSNRLEGVVVERSRINEIVLKGSEPRARPEEEVAGYRNALNWVHSSFAELDMTTDNVLKLHRIMYEPTTADHGGKWKRKDNVIVEKESRTGKEKVRFRPVKAAQTEEAMNVLCRNYQEAKGRRVDGMVLVPLTILDFLCIHPFIDGNGRVARLLTTLLLLREGYTIGRYVSLERTIESSKEWYYEALKRSSQGWHDSIHDPKPWLRFFWWMIDYSYRDLEGRMGRYTSGGGLKTEMIRDAVARRNDPFATIEIMDELPTVSRDLIIRVLADMKSEGLVELKSKGRNSKWQSKAPR